MLPIHVALVRYGSSEVDERTLLRVAAALQIQVTRDFTPLWGVSATVSPYLELSDVPPASIPLVIVPQDRLLEREHAFHTTVHGVPIGLIEARKDWSFMASHELLELLADPQGKRTVVGNSLADSGPDAPDPPQGSVEYLVEICDPCQAEFYFINGIQVADFVTPDYYASGTTGQRYSLTGRVQGPLDVLKGGYITWRASVADDPVWQKKLDANGKETTAALSLPAASMAREWVDYVTDILTETTRSSGPQAADEAAQARLAADEDERARQVAGEAEWASQAAELYGQRITNHVRHILDETYATKPPAKEQTALRDVLTKLAYDPAFYAEFKTDSPTRTYWLEELGLPATIYANAGEIPTQAQFKKVCATINDLDARQAPIAKAGFSGKVRAMWMQGAT
jgi:hypothetical protein